MLIIVEGVDGSGKTTLIKELANRLEELNINYSIDTEALINTKPNTENRVSSGVLVFNMLYMINANAVYICDRSPISDIIYRTFDDYNVVINLSLLFELWQDHKSNMIMIHCDTAKSLELLTKRGDNNKIAFEKHKEIKYLYSQIMPLFNSLKYDFTTDNEFVNNIVSQIAEKFRGR